jgi:hypothetical protein
MYAVPKAQICVEGGGRGEFKIGNAKGLDWTGGHRIGNPRQKKIRKGFGLLTSHACHAESDWSEAYSFF